RRPARRESENADALRVDAPTVLPIVQGHVDSALDVARAVRQPIRFYLVAMVAEIVAGMRRRDNDEALFGECDGGIGVDPSRRSRSVRENDERQVAAGDGAIRCYALPGR